MPRQKKAEKAESPHATRPVGRPQLLTPDVQARITQALRSGNFFGVSCLLARISPSTGKSWLTRGKTGEQPFADFLNACQEADAQCQAIGTNLIMKAVQNDPKQAALVFKLFAIKFPKRWRETNSVELSGGKSPVRVTLADIDKAMEAVALNETNTAAADDKDGGE